MTGRRVTAWRAPISTTPSSLTRIGDLVAFAASGALYVTRAQADGGLAVARFDGLSGLPTLVSAIDYDAASDRLWLAGPGGVSRLDDARRTLDAALLPVPSLLSEANP